MIGPTVVTLRFTSMFSSRQELGPIEGMFFVGRRMIEHPSGHVLAEYEDGVWKVGGSYFVRVDFEGVRPLMIHFLRSDRTPSPSIAPVLSGFVADGSLYAESRHIARYQESSGNWVSSCGREWPVIVAEPS